jgi:ABC-type transport system involved in multi-copper enzyme maturation permease subunit
MKEVNGLVVRWENSVIRAIVWKEFREQGLICLTLIVLGSGVLTAAAVLADPPLASAAPADVIRYLGIGLIATMLLSITAGMVSGSALFAAEREAGTIGFLESLPVSRWRLWWAKFLAGAALALVQVSGVLAVAFALGLVVKVGWIVAVVVYSLLAFCWGTYGSTRARTTLGSVGLAIPAASLATITFLLPIMYFLPNSSASLPRTEGMILFLVLMFATPILISAMLFTSPDRDRARAAADTLPRGRPVPVASPQSNGRATVSPENTTRSLRSRAGLNALVWLSTRQLLRPGLFLSAFALVFGLGILLPPLQPVLLWPALALAAGVFSGVTMMADEQTSGAARYWGERRLPLGRAWTVKAAIHSALVIWLLLLLALPSIVRAFVGDGWPSVENVLSQVFRSRLFEEGQLGSQGWKFLLVPAAYGFAAGQLCGLLFRKTVVAAGVAGLIGSTAAALWAPSLLAGGVAHWQLWLPPAALLVTGRLLMRAWGSDRLTAPASITRLVSGGGVALLILAAGIGYRVLEVPDRADGEADVWYVTNGLISVDAKNAGRELRSAAEQFSRVAAPLGPGGELLLLETRTRAEESAERYLVSGFPPTARQARESREVLSWLARIYDSSQQGFHRDENWYQLANVASQQPTGIYEHPLLTSSTSGTLALENGRRMAVAILTHGLQLQAEGDPAEFVTSLRTALSLGRSMRNGSLIAAYIQGFRVTLYALIAGDRWLHDLSGRPDLLRAALRVVLEDEWAIPTRVLPDGQTVQAQDAQEDTGTPFDPTPHLLAERYILREMSKAPGQWLPDQLTPPGMDKEMTTSVVDLIGFAWSVPWERERTRRLIGLGLEAGRSGNYQSLLRGRPGGRVTRPGGLSPKDLVELDRQLRVFRRAMALKLAIRLYQAEKGTVPAELGALVTAGYLTAIPTDPYINQPFRYAVAGPEGITFARSHTVPVPGGPGHMAAPSGPGPNPTPPTATVIAAAPGQARIWSVGPNERDDGGLSLPVALSTNGSSFRADDLVFLVPLAPGQAGMGERPAP